MKTKKRSLMSLFILAVLSAAALTGCVSLDVLSQKAEGTVVKTTNSLGEEEDDYAVKYTVQVRNKGMEGRVRAIGELYTPEGQFYREEIVDMSSEEVRTFVFIFTEPTFLGTALEEFRYKFRYESVQ